MTNPNEQAAPERIWIQKDLSFFQATGNGAYYRDPDRNSIEYVRADLTHSVPQPKDTELLEFLDEVDVWVSDRIEFPAPLMARKWLGQLSRELRKRLPQPKDVRD